MNSNYCNDLNEKTNLLKKSKSFKNLSVEEIENAIRPYYSDFYPSLQQRIAEETSLRAMAKNYYNKLHPEVDSNKSAIKIKDKPTDQNACLDAFNTMMIQAVETVIDLTAVPESVASCAAKSIVEELGEDALNSLSETILDIMSSESLFDQATAFATLVIDAANIISVPTFVDIVLNSLSFWEYVLYAAGVSAQLLAWFGTDSLALVGELVADAESVYSLVQQAIATNNVCNL